MHTGVPAYVDGSMQPVVQSAGGRLINGDRMWHYVEGIENWDRSGQGTRSESSAGPAQLWLDARGQPPGALWLTMTRWRR